MADATVRTIARVYFTRRNLLEWTTAAQAKSTARVDLTGFYRRMAGSVVIAAVVAVAVWLAEPDSAPLAAPFVVLWLFAPLIARAVSLPPAGIQR